MTDKTKSRGLDMPSEKDKYIEERYAEYQKKWAENPPQPPTSVVDTGREKVPVNYNVPASALDVTLILAITMLITSFLYGIFNRRYARAIQWKYSKKLSKWHAFLSQFTAGFLALVFFMISAI